MACMGASGAIGRRIVACLLPLAGALALIACGSDEKSSEATAAPPATHPDAGGKLYSRAAQLQPGSEAQLLSLPTADVSVGCDEDGAGARVKLKARGATSYGVVTSREGHPIQPTLQPGQAVTVPIETPDVQTWTISPFSAGSAQPTVITIGVSDSQPPNDIYQCAVTAMAAVGSPGITVTK